MTARLLSDRQSPPNNPEGWIANIVPGNPGQASIYFEGNPNVSAATPASPYRTSFQLFKWAPDCVPSGTVQCFDLLVNSFKVKKKETLTPSYESFSANSQYLYVMYSNNAVYGQSGSAFIYEFYAGDSAPSLETPHLSITFSQFDAATVLEYCTPGADQYQVQEYHGGATTNLYTGSACSIRTNRSVGGTNKYAVRAHFPAGWSATTPYVALHY